MQPLEYFIVGDQAHLRRQHEAAQKIHEPEPSGAETVSAQSERRKGGYHRNQRRGQNRDHQAVEKIPSDSVVPNADIVGKSPLVRQPEGVGQKPCVVLKTAEHHPEERIKHADEHDHHPCADQSPHDQGGGRKSVFMPGHITRPPSLHFPC